MQVQCLKKIRLSQRLLGPLGSGNRGILPALSHNSYATGYCLNIDRILVVVNSFSATYLLCFYNKIIVNRTNGNVFLFRRLFQKRFNFIGRYYLLQTECEMHIWRILIILENCRALFNSFCFSDPFFALSFLVNSWIPGMLDAMGQATFLCALLMFWLCIYHGLRQVF